ncbi:PPE family protein [Mycobacterium uberis]|uniref:PPE family protein n=1 Tax=Mycobacterium uberis TaxID=2162698 RepID=A0A3E1HKA9_9MYCO|nr:PPE family protein [Mycobacterium uberis]RFD26807.1 PPE family protein [Mycobacterium uberis]
MFDFAALPPETNSTRMYLGAGSGPILAAATAWTGLAKELTAAAQGLESAIDTLLATFMGPSATTLLERVTPYVGWLNMNAESAERTANQVTAAANAYEAAYLTTVPPLTVFTNRAEWLTLTVTNIFGQNSLAIAEKEAEYGEMWIQDATAMAGYQAGVLEAVVATIPFMPAPEMVSEFGLTQEACAAEQAFSQVALNQVASQGMNVTSKLGTPQLNEQVGVVTPQALPRPSSAAKSLWEGGTKHLSSMSNLVGMTNNGVSMLGQAVSQTNTMGSMMKGFMPTAAKAAKDAAKAMESAVELVGRSPLNPGLGGQITANLGRATSVGSLRVPETWAVANQSITQVRGLPLTSIVATAEGESGQMMGELPMAPMASGGGGVGVSSALRLPPRPFTMPRNLAGG